MYVKMVIRPMYKKDVSTPPNKMKHISPLQGHVFLPLTCRILKRNHIFFTISLNFCHDWQRVQEARNLHPRNIKMIKNDQGGTRNPYKWMNVMKQDVTDDKIKERCKTCEKQCMQEDLNRLRSCQAEANLDGLNSYRTSIEQIESVSMDRESVEKLSRQSPKSLMD